MLTVLSTSDIYHLLYAFMTTSNNDRVQVELDNFIAKAIQKDDYTFATGLLGAGWLFAYRHQHCMFTGDIDEFLYDFDDNFYTLAIQKIVKTDSCLDDLFPLIDYYQQRLQNSSISHNFYRRFTLFEIMKLLVDKLILICMSDQSTCADQIRILLKLSYLTVTCVSEKEIEMCYYTKTEELVSYYQNLHDLSVEDRDNLKWLQLASAQYANPYWVDQIKTMLIQKDADDCNSKSILDDINIFLEENKEDYFNLKNYNFKEDQHMFYMLVSNIKRLQYT